VKTQQALSLRLVCVRALRAFCWVWVGGVALSCGGATSKHGSDGAATGGKSEPTAGAAASATSATGGAGPDAGGSTGPKAGSSVGASSAVAGSTQLGGAAGEADANGIAGEAGSPPDTFDASCPASPPASRGGCAPELRCSYGDELRPWCRTSARCQDGRWLVDEPVCPQLASCDTIQYFGEGHECDPAATFVCRNETSYLCSCAGAGQAKWSCARDMAASICPHPGAPNEGDPCPMPTPDFPYDCYYSLCPGTGQSFVARCETDGHFHYTNTCKF
jgi:hypothetical protein